MSSEKISTKEKILAATEQLLAENGFDAVSLRDITTTADVNVAAVNYHFGSKEKLFEDVLFQYINPINEQRLTLLKQLTADGRVATLREILDAFIRPFLSIVTESRLKEQLFFKLMGRCISDQQLAMSEPAMTSFEELIKEFTMAMSAALPNVSMEQLYWRLHYTFGVMAHALIHADTLKQCTNGACGDPSMESQLAQIIDFCHAGVSEEKLG